MQNNNEHIEIRHFLCFWLKNDLLALNALCVHEVIDVINITHVPNMPPHVSGVINFRGDILPVIDLHELLNINNEAITGIKLVILEISGTEKNECFKVAITVNKVEGVKTIAHNKISNIPDMESHINLSFIEGIFKDDQHEMVMIMKHEKMFAIEELTKE